MNELRRRRELRQSATNAEAVLWFALRGRRLDGYKFRRQHPVGPYVLDFFCAERSLGLELDGGQHFEPEARRYDLRRTAFVRRYGIALVRFRNDEILCALDAVLEVIARALRGGMPSEDFDARPGRW